MAIIPLIFFSLLLLYIIKRNGFDISACITTMYVITSFFGFVLSLTDEDFGYSNYSEIELGIIPTLVYCLLIGACIYPFYKYRSNIPRHLLPLRRLKLFNFLVFCYFANFLLILFIYKEDLLLRFLWGDLGELRKMYYEGQLQNVVDGFSGFKRHLATIITILGTGGYFMIPIFFYSLCVLKKGLLFNLMILLSSTSPMVIGMLNIDRSTTFFWFLLSFFSYILFRPYIVTKREKRLFRIIAFTIGGLLATYIIAVSISRFGERDSGTSGGLLYYIGQPYVNFCLIWDKVWLEEFHTDRIFPLTNFLLYGNNAEELVDYVDSIYSRTGVHVNVFFSFIGLFLVDTGHFGALLFPIILFWVIRSCTSNKVMKKVLRLYDFFILFALGAILQCGIITYFYTNMQRVVTLILFVIVLRFLSIGKSGYK